MIWMIPCKTSCVFLQIFGAVWASPDAAKDRAGRLGARGSVWRCAGRLTRLL